MKYLQLYEEFENGITFKEFLKKAYDPYYNTNLEFSRNNLIDLEGIEVFSKATRIGLRENKLTSLEGIENLPFLKQIQCSKNNLVNLKGVELLPDLEDLRCSENQLTNLDEILNPEIIYSDAHGITGQKQNIKHLVCFGNPFKFPLPSEFIEKFLVKQSTPRKIENIYSRIYDTTNIKHFQTYECQKEFLTLYPYRVKDLIPFGFHERIKEEFPALIRGEKWGFFDLKENKDDEWEYYNNKAKYINEISEKEKIIEFIKFVVDIKGTDSSMFKKYGLKTIDIFDSINGDFIRYLYSDAIVSNEKTMHIDTQTLEKLKSLQDYLKKKYPELATGKEWGFFDLENTK